MTFPGQVILACKQAVHQVSIINVTKIAFLKTYFKGKKVVGNFTFSFKKIIKYSMEVSQIPIN